MKSATLLTITVFASIANTNPISSSQARSIGTRQDNTTFTEPCAEISKQMWGDGHPVGPIGRDYPAKLAMDCLTSIPFNATTAKRLIRGLRPCIDFQSTLTILKNPPAEYAAKVQLPVDIIAGLDKIDAYIDSGRYKNEYELGWAVYSLAQSAHDGHFTIVLDVIGAYFSWHRPVPLVSVSADGKQLPNVFVFADVLGMHYKNISYTPSPVTEIDGISAVEFLENLSQYGGPQDRDALYNDVFYELAQVSIDQEGTGAGMFTGGGRGGYVYPGPTTTLKFANGSEYTMQNYAHTDYNFCKIVSGKDLIRDPVDDSRADAEQTQFRKLETSSMEVSPIEPMAAPGFPSPVIAGPPKNFINGYYVDAPGYEEIAVLQVPTFVSAAAAEVPFQAVSQTFLPKAIADGKSKLIIDLQANGGGTILQAYDMFKQLFPGLDPYGANNIRATETTDLIGQSYSNFASRFKREPTLNDDITAAQTSFFDYHMDLTLKGKSFSS